MEHTQLTSTGLQSTTEWTREEKLNHLIDILQRDYNNFPMSWNMNFWHVTSKEYSCGYAGCALGHAAIDPIFNELGLTLCATSTSDVLNRQYSTIQYIHGKAYSNMMAGSQFFELTMAEANFIFDVDEYYTHSSNIRVLGDVETKVGEENLGKYYFLTYDADSNDVLYSDIELDEMDISVDMVVDHIKFVRDNPNYLHERFHH